MLALIIGPSGSGKTSVANKLNYPKVISTTTRAMRENEIDGVDYHFVSLAEFKTLDLVESTVYADNYYGYQRKDIQKCESTNTVYLGVVDKVGVVAMRGVIGKDNVLAISIRASKSNLLKWMRHRGDDEELIQKRIKHLEESDEILENEKIADICTINKDFDELTRTINKCIIDRLRKLNNGLKQSKSRR